MSWLIAFLDEYRSVPATTVRPEAIVTVTIGNSGWSGSGFSRWSRTRV